jgi:uncharacterized protein
MASGKLSLTSHWYVAPGCEAAVLEALQKLADDVYRFEPDTLTYLVHTSLNSAEAPIQSLPPVNPRTIVFFESYRSPEAFLRHVNGPVFTEFVTRNSSLFVNSNGKPFTSVEFYTQVAGFMRNETSAANDSQGNLHPSVMFEIIANNQAVLKDFYSQVFGWRYRVGTAGFAYVHFPERTPPLLGGIGQANPSVPGFEPGHSFYILVDDLNAAIERAIAAGGSKHMPPSTVDDYSFAMVKDPEGNAVGLILPFES